MVEPYLVVCGLLLAGSALARGLPVQRFSFDDDHEDGWDLNPRELAYLRCGAYGVVLTVLAELHGVGSVDLREPGRARQLDPPNDYEDRLATAVYAGLNWSRRPPLLVLLPSIRRECAGLRDDLRVRLLLPPTRRYILAAALAAYAVGLAVATTLERAAEGSTVVSAVVVAGLATVAWFGPRRTVAGQRELRAHRWALREAIEAGADEADLLADLVAGHGRAATDVLCGSVVVSGGYIPSGALIPRGEPVRATEPIRIPARRVTELPAAWRRPVYDSVSEGPAIIVRRAFVAATDRAAA